LAAVRPLSITSSSHAPQRIGALAAVVLHVIAGTVLLSHEPSRQAMLAAVPVMVDLITPPRIEPKPVPPVEIPPPKPRPKPVVKPVIREPDPPPVLAAPVEAPTPIEVAPPPPPPPPPAPAPVIVAPAPPVVVPVTPPIFAADYLDNPSPPYPVVSRRLGEQGRVVLRVLVNAGGGADQVEVRTSSGHVRLDEAARETVRRWRFVPAKRGEQPVPAWVLIPISFRLEG
jgi:periplasmic protein TonB